MYIEPCILNIQCIYAYIFQSLQLYVFFYTGVFEAFTKTHMHTLRHPQCGSHMHIHTDTNTNIHTHISAHIHTHIYTPTRTHTYIYIFIFILQLILIHNNYTSIQLYSYILYYI